MARKSVRSLLLTALLATPLLSYATQYPLTVTDLDGRQVTLAKEPQRIILQDGRDIMTLALLDRDNPFKRLVAWNNLAKKQDVATWQMLKTTWPQSATILDMGFSDKGNVDFESVIARQPDLMIAQLRARPALMESGVIDKLSALHVPVLFVDYEIDPAKDTAPSIDLLGKVLNRESQAKAFTDYYRQQLQTIRQKTAAITPKANVFVEALAGNSDACCFTHGHSGWGGLVEAVGANNIGSQLLPGASGFVSLEKIISMKPDAWIMTGSKRGNSQVLPLGYAVKPEAVKAQAQTLLAALLLDGITRWTQVATSGVILFGIALVFTFNALVSMLQFIANEDTLQGLVFWTMGSIDRASWSKVAILLVALALVMPLSLRSAWKLTALRLGEDRAISFGINVRRLRLTTLLRISILSALSVAFVGPIGFIGLVAPHIARMLFGEDHRFYLPASALIGALVLSLASIASKNLIPGAIIPVGIVTSLVGVPFFLSIILRHRGQV